MTSTPANLAVLAAAVLIGPLGALGGGPAAAQPYLVTDLNRAAGDAIGSYPAFVGNLDGLTVFRADDRFHGAEPWVSDGTAAGTLPLGDLVPGLGASNPQPGVRIGGRLVFPTRDDAAALSELWRTDGTPAGTSLLAAFPALDRFSDPAKVGAGLPGAPVLFSAYDDVRGNELWATDGTAHGTRLVADIRPGAGSSSPFGWVAVGGRILFTAADDGGRELWRTDGTTAGTKRVKDISPGPASSIESVAEPDCGHDWITVGVTGWLAPLGGTVLFVADDGVHGDELWRSDGTAAGTRMVADLTPGSEGTRFFSRLEVGGGRAFFLAAAGGTGAQLWVTDGSAAGTRQLSAFTGDAASDRCQLPRSFEVIDGVAYFLAGPTVSELWTSDGTAGGTRSLGICAGEFCEEPSVPTPTAVGLLFRGDDGVHGSEPWTTDGTPAGTRMVADLCSPDCSSYPGGFTDVGGAVVFAAAPEAEVFIPVLWRTDGTAAGTVRLDGPLQVGTFFPPAPASGGAGPFVLVAGADATGSGEEPWRTDGTDAGTFLLADVAASGTGDADPVELTAVGDRLFFVADDGVHGAEVWRTDGRAAGTVRLSDVAPGAPGPPDPAAAEVGRLAPAPGGGVAFVAARGDVDAVEWWRTGGVGGATRLLTIPRAGFALDQYATASAGGRLFLLGPGLWASDGTAAGTDRVGDFTFAGGPVALGGELYFVVQVFAPAYRVELWKSDGTAAGTVPVCGPDPADGGCAFSDLRDARVVGGRLLFLADSGQGRALWTTDGTAEGTVEVRELPPGLWPPYDVTAVGDRLVFFATGEAGTYPVLWTSDGTAAGTFELSRVATDSFNGGLVPQIVSLPGRACFLAAFDLEGEGGVVCTDGTAPGTVRHPDLPNAGRRPTGVWAAGGGRVVLLAERFIDSGSELWVSDLTPAGSTHLADLATPMLALPPRLAVAGGHAFFPAVDADTGVELWAVSLAGAGPPPEPEPPPAAPDRLSAAAVSVSAIGLSWRDNSTDEDRFVVEATSPLNVSFQVVSVVPADTRSTVVGGLVSGIPYTFRVYAENDAGPSPPSAEASATPFAVAGPCAPAEGVLCLGAGRFAISVWWRDQHNFGQGQGRAVPLPGSELTGAFWFFNPANLELLLKVLDGTSINGHLWVFYGGLTDVETWVTVTDTQEGRNRTYHDPPGGVRGRADTEAF